MASPNQIRILYIHQDGLMTGSGLSLLNIIENIDRKKFDISILLGNEGPLKEKITSLGLKCDIVPFHSFWGAPPPSVFSVMYWHNWKAFLPNKALNNHLREAAPSIIHLNDKVLLKPGIYGKRLGFKIVWHLRSSYADKKNWLQFWISKSIISYCADVLLSISEDELDGFKRHKKSVVVYNSVSIEKADEAILNEEKSRKHFNISKDTVNVCMIGNLNKQKGAWNFIRAAGKAQKLAPELSFRFYIAAPIPERNLNFGIRGKLGLIDATHPADKVSRLATEHGIEDKVTLLGRVENVLDLMVACDVVCACFDLQAIGRPGFEAAAVGKPVIVNAGHTGNSKVVIPGKTGIIVKKENPDELAAALISLATDNEYREKLGRAGYLHARQFFNSKTNVEKIQEIYKTLAVN